MAENTFYIIIAVFALVLFYVRVLEPIFIKRKEKMDKKFSNKTYIRKTGSTRTYGPNGFDNPVLNYDLRSWDGGKNWYAVNLNIISGEMQILGKVEEVYPGLFSHLESWDRITKRLDEKGPLDITDPEDLRILGESGFTIMKK